jgi:hypothetical protein
MKSTIGTRGRTNEPTALMFLVIERGCFHHRHERMCDYDRPKLLNVVRQGDGGECEADERKRIR